MEVWTFDLVDPLTQLIRLHVASQTFELLVPLTQLSRLRVANAGVNHWCVSLSLSLSLSLSHSID